MEEETSEGKVFATFEKHHEFLGVQKSILSLDLALEPSLDENRREDLQLLRLSDILDEYQEQAYLLDPFLEELVAPVVECLKAHAKSKIASNPDTSISESRVGRLALLLYNYIKFRGYKTITRFFPHEIADLSIALEYIRLSSGSVGHPSQWALRYVVLLWLSLICMIPFDLEQFDERDQIGQTASQIEQVAKSYLGTAGLEREGAAILLSRLYMRKDTGLLLPAFLQSTSMELQNSNNPFHSVGLMRVLCEVTKSGAPEQIQTHQDLFFDISRIVKQNKYLMSNTVVRKLRIKLVTRVVLRLFPARVYRVRQKGPALSSNILPTSVAKSDNVDDVDIDDDIDVPEETEPVLEELFNALEDKDTVVRYSSAKGVARIAERLPLEFTAQVLDTILALFERHSLAAASLYDMPSLAEGLWHGACLACAEMARRGLVADEKLATLIRWLAKALYFDIRKGAHSVGSNVRDAASYVLWSLARAQSVLALAPHAEELSRRLVTVALFDREIHIRRAASAAFQEYVGRTSLFPHGIDVLRKTDFYAVGVRRNAFLVAAPEVAEHEVYRSFLIDHLISVTLRHWDPTMRKLGAQSLRAISTLNFVELGPGIAHRIAELLKLPDTGDIHGGLLALTELAAASREYETSDDVQRKSERRQIFSYLANVPSDIILSPRHENVTAAACYLIASGISSMEIQQNTKSSVPSWSTIVDFGLKSNSSTVQEAASAAMASVSSLVDCSATVDSTLIRDFKNGSPPMQQSLCRVLGVLDYNAYPHGLLKAVKCLLDCVDSSSILNVEARRNAFLSMPMILSNILPKLVQHLTSETVCQVIDALQNGLDDYTSDQRGDVGSWIRVACINGLTSTAELFFTHAKSIPNFEKYLPSSKYHNIFGGILKQGVERLDNVRQQAGENLLRMISLPLPDIVGAEAWRISGDTLMRELFLDGSERVGWNDSSWIFPRAVKLLEIEQYRDPVLRGLVMSASSKTDSTQRPVSASFVAYARSLPNMSTQSDRYDLQSLARDLLTQAKRNLSSNHVVVPVLQTLNVLLEGDTFEPLSKDTDGLSILEDLLAISSRNIPRLKNPQRILMSMKIVVNLLSFVPLRGSCIAQLSSFLAHSYPKVRVDTAEYLYIMLQSKDIGYDTDEVEEILLETEWSSSDITLLTDTARRCTAALSGNE